jgi:aldo/keto reductase family oxidoreductase
MNYRRLGNLKVSSVGLGCMGMSQSYGAPADRGQMRELIAAAVDMGITHFDTAEVYGTPDDPHDNERLVGAALASCRDKVVVATKFGIRFDMRLLKEGKSPIVPDARPETIRMSVDGSLQRLGTDWIDLYYQHRVDPKIPIEEVAGVMGELIKEGKIRHWGISEATEEDIRRAHAVCPLTAVQNRYSMMARSYEALFPVLEELNIGFVAFSPFANGVLTGAYGKDTAFGPGDMRTNMPQFSAEAMEKNRYLLTFLRDIAEEKNASSGQIALAWMLSKKPYIAAIPGTRKHARLAENAGAADVLLTSGEIAAIDERLNTIPMSGVFGVNSSKV